MSRLLSTEGIILSHGEPSEKHRLLFLFSREHGVLRIYQRISSKKGAGGGAMDLFDEVQVQLQTTSHDLTNPQGQLWFVQQEPLFVRRYAELGRNYETLLHASNLSGLLAKNPVHEESREGVYGLLQKTLDAFSKYSRADIVHVKALYTFARDEGYPVKQEWLPSLAAKTQGIARSLLNTPVDKVETSTAEVSFILDSLVQYLKGHTEMTF